MPQSALDLVSSPSGGLVEAPFRHLSNRRVCMMGGREAKKNPLRIANGAAGQSGLIGAWADAFIQYYYRVGIRPFRVAWYLGDTADSLSFITAGKVDITVTHDEAAEKQGEKTKSAAREKAWVPGPRSDPTQFADCGDDLAIIVDQGNKFLVKSVGNKTPQTPLDDRNSVRFLSRFDKKALFCKIGQCHQYPRFPLQTLREAYVSKEYTLSDRGAWLSSPTDVTSVMKTFAEGRGVDPDDPLLSPAHLLRGKKFMTWKVIRDFKSPSGLEGERFYSEAPEEHVL
ncbi:hypothetical protein BDN67DRAFT_998707 [Paxillus ammoniavirescens]|nr:hypothetical protein BDN67DRAFT_998707 [Paxillus ammoniavirescens]